MWPPLGLRLASGPRSQRETSPLVLLATKPRVRSNQTNQALGRWEVQESWLRSFVLLVDLADVFKNATWAFVPASVRNVNEKLTGEKPTGARFDSAK